MNDNLWLAVGLLSLQLSFVSLVFVRPYRFDAIFGAGVIVIRVGQVWLLLLSS